MPVEPPVPPGTDRRFRPATPVVIGLVGGIAAGKSTVADLFARRGLCRVDADVLARAVAAEPEVVAEVAAAFGPAAAPDGRLDRARLAALVFRDAAARQRLEAILHPRIRTRIVAELDAARARGDSVLLDAPLLIETGLAAHCDHVVFVDAPDAERARRAAARGWDEAELERREAAQLPVHEKRARAAYVVDNGGDLGATERQVDAVLYAVAASHR